MNGSTNPGFPSFLPDGALSGVGLLEACIPARGGYVVCFRDGCTEHAVLGDPTGREAACAAHAGPDFLPSRADPNPRRPCRSCGKIYNGYACPPPTCGHCGGVFGK